jgi:hypothetical protein
MTILKWVWQGLKLNWRGKKAVKMRQMKVASSVFEHAFKRPWLRKAILKACTAVVKL